jgi:hypothetical protein
MITWHRESAAIVEGSVWGSTRSYALISRVFQGESEGLTPDDILDNITITCLTNTALSGARLYWGKGYFNAKGAFPSRLP